MRFNIQTIARYVAKTNWLILLNEGLLIDLKIGMTSLSSKIFIRKLSLERTQTDLNDFVR